ncbi:MAG: hypothetical protein Q8K75_11215 [Chlamydiales bacterium]|nr:hypothetical protein [Chlamydiales bacterium]
MSRKQKTKKISGPKLPFFQPSVTWIPAFFAGLCLGIFINFIPGMDIILGSARQAVKEETSATNQAIMWRPQINRSAQR